MMLAILLRFISMETLQNLKFVLLPSTTKLRQGYIFICVCQSFCSWGGGRVMYPSMYWDRHPLPSAYRDTHYLFSACWNTQPPGLTPLGRHPLGKHPIPWADTPLGRHPPGQAPLGRYPLPSACWDTHPSRDTPLGRHP